MADNEQQDQPKRGRNSAEPLTGPPAPTEQAGTAPVAQEVTPAGGRSSLPRLATTGYLSVFRHPDVPDVYLTPQGPRDAGGQLTSLTSEQAEKFRKAAERSRTRLRDLNEK